MSDKINIVKVLKNIDVIISDIDGTITPCNTFSLLSSPRNLFKLEAWKHSLEIGSSLISRDKGKQIKCWRNFYYKVLSHTFEVDSRYKKWAQKRIFPYVTDFFSCFPKSKKIFVTQNVDGIGNLYKSILKFHDVFCNQDNKKNVVEKIVLNNNYKNYLVIGNSCEDRNMLDYLNWARGNSLIKEVVGIYVAGKYNKKCQSFDINIKNNEYGKLVELLDE